MAGKLVKMAGRYRGPNGMLYERDKVYNVSRQVARSWCLSGRAELVEGEEAGPSHVLKAFARAPAHQAHDHPFKVNANGAPDPTPEKPRATPNELPKFHIDGMSQTELLDWLDSNVPDHGYNKRFGMKTLRKAVKVEVRKKKQQAG